MKTIMHRCILFTFILCLFSPAHGALSIADTPLSLATGVDPNILLAIDDSGSMDSEILVPTNDGALWWHDDDESFVGRDKDDVSIGGATLNVNKAGGANGTWKKFIYLFPNGTGNGKRVYGDSSNDHFAVPPIPLFGFARSPVYNKAYFNPYDLYVPWPSVGATYDNIDPAAAPSDPEIGSDTFNLTAEISTNSDNHRFIFFEGMPGGPDSGKEAKAVSYYPATFYLEEPLNSAFGFTGTTTTGFAPDGSTTLYGYEIKSANFASTAQYNAMIQNFANWFSYYRKRHLATRAGVARSLFDVRKARAGFFTINHRNDVAMKSLDDDAQRNSFYSGIYDLGGNSGGTPNLDALRHAGHQYQRRDNDAPITRACQANATILFTDGYSNYPDNLPNRYNDIGNEDAGDGAPFEDSVSETIADIAMKFYENNLRPSDYTAGQVPVDAACNLSPVPPDLNCNSNLHMLTYAVTLGGKGLLYDPANPSDPFTATPSWHLSFENRSPKAVDDLWHATINGRGEMLNAAKPVEIAGKLQEAITHILQSVGSASAIATNSTRLDTDTLIFQARFDSRDWSGQILAYEVASDGSLGAIKWDTGNCSACIPPANSRNILTWKTTGTGEDGTTFEWANLDATQQAYLSTGVDAAAVASVGPQRVAWLRGDQSLEGIDPDVRIRSRRLGDIVNSNPYFHWQQDFGFNKLPDAAGGSSYAAYLSAKANRPAMVYVGANDGMLHGFKAEDGSELFAYIPYGIYDELDELTQADYQHRYYVDGSPRVLDAYFSDGAWHSVLVASTGAGGKSVFAIDVTHPDSVGAEDILWEYRSNMGVAMSDPVIARLDSGDWVAIFGNGYDSGTTLKLLIVNLETGALIKAIDTGISGTDNGLGDVVPVDSDGDRTTEAVYAGDLQGNVWKFDLDHSNSNQWDVAFSSQGNPVPFFVAEDASGARQPITGRMTVGRHPDGGVMLYFGTGKYFEEGDASVGATPQTQSFYGLRDNGASVSRSDLVAQTITDDDDRTLSGSNNTATADLREVSDNAVDYSSHKGWYLDLKLAGAADGGGERVIDQGILRHGRLIFPTLIPSADPCNFGGTGWLMEVDAMTGGRLDNAVLDVNGDGLINHADLVDNSGTPIPPSGLKFDQMITRPGIVGAGEKEYKYTSGSRGTIGVTTERGDGDVLGRQSWWQLR